MPSDPPRPPASTRDSAPRPSPEVPAADAATRLGPLAPFAGTWRGEGRGTYPTIDDFAYGEEIRLRDVGRPHLVYEQRTWAPGDGRPLHAESGYWRPKPGGRIELVIAQATGMVEIDEGTCIDRRIAVASRAVAAASTGPDVTAVTRNLVVEGAELRYELRMEAVGQPLLVHLVARLRRVADEPA